MWAPFPVVTFLAGRDAPHPAEKHPDRLSWLQNSRRERKQPSGDWWSLKLYNGIPGKGKSWFLPRSLWGSYRGGMRWQQLTLLTQRKSSFTCGCERAGHNQFPNVALQAFRKPAFLILIWPILKYTLNSIFMLKLNVWIMTLPACVQLFVAICVYITMQLWLDEGLQYFLNSL